MPPVAVRAIAVVSLSILASCGGSPTAPVREPLASAPPQAPEPSDVRSSELDQYIETTMRELGIPGATILVSHAGTILVSKGYGLANVELQVPASPDTAYEISSVTKLFTACAALILNQEGKLDLDLPISRYLEDLPESHARLTARHLLTHTSGLEPDHFAVEKLYGPSLMRYTVEEQLADLLATPLSYEPGTKLQYANSNAFLLGVLIAKLSGMPYEELIRKRILEPAKMKNTSFIDVDAVVPGRAQQYTRRKGQLKRWSLEQTIQALDGNAFAGLISTAPDLLRFHQALIANQIVSEQTRGKMLTPHRLPDGSTAGNPSKIGLGWWIRDDVAGHRCASHLGHTGTAFFHCPDDDIAVVILTNLGKGYAHIKDQGIPSSKLHEIADNAIKMLVNGTKRSSHPRPTAALP